MASILQTEDLLPTFLQAQSLLALEDSKLPTATLATAFVVSQTTHVAFACARGCDVRVAPSASHPSSRPWGCGKGGGKGTHYNNSWRMQPKAMEPSVERLLLDVASVQSRDSGYSPGLPHFPGATHANFAAASSSAWLRQRP